MKHKQAQHWWDTFSETGSLGAYLMYRSLLEKESELPPPK